MAVGTRFAIDHRRCCLLTPQLLPAKLRVMLRAVPQNAATRHHGQSFRATPIHSSGRSDTRRQKHAGGSAGGAAARAAHRRARRQPVPALLLRWRARRRFSDADGVPGAALRATQGAGCGPEVAAGGGGRLHLRKRQALRLPEPDRLGAGDLQPLLRRVPRAGAHTRPGHLPAGHARGAEASACARRARRRSRRSATITWKRSPRPTSTSSFTTPPATC